MNVFLSIYPAVFSYFPLDFVPPLLIHYFLFRMFRPYPFPPHPHPLLSGQNSWHVFHTSRFTTCSNNKTAAAGANLPSLAITQSLSNFLAFPREERNCSEMLKWGCSSLSSNQKPSKAKFFRLWCYGEAAGEIWNLITLMWKGWKKKENHSLQEVRFKLTWK